MAAGHVSENDQNLSDINRVLLIAGLKQNLKKTGQRCQTQKAVSNSVARCQPIFCFPLRVFFLSGLARKMAPPKQAS